MNIWYIIDTESNDYDETVAYLKDKFSFAESIDFKRDPSEDQVQVEMRIEADEEKLNEAIFQLDGKRFNAKGYT